MADEPENIVLALLRKIDQQVPRDLAIIITKAIDKEPSRRYPSSEALADDLGRSLRGEPIQARPVGQVERAHPVVMGEVSRLDVPPVGGEDPVTGRTAQLHPVVEAQPDDRVASRDHERVGGRQLQLPASARPFVCELFRARQPRSHR